MLRFICGVLMMNRDEILRILEVRTFDSSMTPVVEVDKSKILKVVSVLKQAGYDMLLCLSCVDSGDCFEIVYNFYSTEEKKSVVVKTHLDREYPEVKSVSSVYPCADWYEREVFDLFGVEFSGHGDLRRLLMPEGWDGYPLRKDYVQKDSRLRWNERR